MKSKLPSSEQCICPKDCKGFDWHCKACHPDTLPSSNPNDALRSFDIIWSLLLQEQPYWACANTMHADNVRLALELAPDDLQRCVGVLRGADETSRDADDAWRYRYLKSHLGLGWGVKLAGGDPHGFAGPTLLDKALDAARGAVDDYGCTGCRSTPCICSQLEPTVSHMGPSGMRCVVAEGCPDPYLCTRARRCERVSPENGEASQK